MKLLDLVSHYAIQLAAEKKSAVSRGFDSPIESSITRKTGTSGTLHLYNISLPNHKTVFEDTPLTIVPPGDLEPTEGHALQQLGTELLIQTLDSLGQANRDNTLVPDTSGFFETASKRLEDIAANPESYTLGPAERLIFWLDPETEKHGPARAGISQAVLTTIWNNDQIVRWTKLGSLVVDLMRKNKRVLLLAPTHQTLDKFMAFLAKTLRNAALPFKSLLSCYEVPTLSNISEVALHEFGFEAQMHHFFTKSRSNKNVLRQKYDRFRELTPILVYKGQMQRDLNEVKLLEWRLFAQVSESQRKIKDIDKTLEDYEKLPIWKRIGMQTIGKNIETLGQYRTIDLGKIKELMKEVEIAQTRIRELSPEASIPKDMKPEYEELKEEITRLGGTKKIREMLAAGEGTNRQAFIQNKRLVASTPGRIIADPLFKRVRFDVLIAEDAPKIPAPFLLGAASLIRERIIIAGSNQDLISTSGQSDANVLWRQHCLEQD